MIGLQKSPLPARLSICLMIATVLLAAWGCSDTTNPPPGFDPDLRGMVVDADGEPMSGVGVLISLWPTVASPMAVQGSFDFPPSGKSPAELLDMHVTDYCGIIVRHLSPGPDHQPGDPILIDGRNDDGLYLPDGIYFVNATYSDTLLVQDFLMVREPHVEISLSRHVMCAVTDEGGGFRISQACLPFDYGLFLADLEDTVRVSRWVHFQIAGDQGLMAVSDSVFVDPGKGAEVSIRID